MRKTRSVRGRKTRGTLPLAGSPSGNGATMARNRKSWFDRLGVSESILIAGAPVAGYALAYLGTMGAAQAYGVPATLVEIGLSDVASNTIRVLAGLGILEAIKSLVRRAPTWLDPNFAFDLGAAVTIPLLWWLFAWTTDWKTLLSVFVVMLLAAIVWEALRRRREAAGAKPETPGIPVSARTYVVSMLLFAMAAAWASGYNLVRNSESHLVVTEGRTRYVVCGVFTSRYVLQEMRRVDGRNTLVGAFRVVPTDSVLDARRVRTGQLTIAKD